MTNALVKPQISVPLCCGLESADSRFMSAMMPLWVRAGEQGRSGLQGGAAGVMTEGQGEGHGEGKGDGWGEGMGDAAFDEDADFDKMEDFS